MLVDILFTISFLMMGSALMLSYRGESIRRVSNIPTLLIASIIIRWLAGLCIYAVMLSAQPQSAPTGHLAALTVGAFGEASFKKLLFIYLSIILFNIFLTSKGISRASEVLARFYLDSVPGRQIAIDADLAAGMIDYMAAKEGRIEINERSSIYSMLDGIGKFMTAENFCSILVLVLFAVIFARDLWGQAASMDRVVAIIGAGLLWQIAQLLNACAYAYILVRISRSADPANKAQLDRRLKLWALAFGTCLALAMLFGSPWPFGLLLVLNYLPEKIRNRLLVRFQPKRMAPVDVAPKLESMVISPLTIEVDCLLGADLIADSKNIAAQIDKLRKLKFMELGFNFPQVTIIDNVTLEQGRYVIRLNGSYLADGAIMVSKLLAVPKTDALGLQRKATAVDPVYGLPCFWINVEDKATALSEGCVLTDAAGILLTHLAKIVSDIPQKMLSLAETQRLMAACPHRELLGQIGSQELQTHTMHKVFMELLDGGFPLLSLDDIVLATHDAWRASMTVTSDIVDHIRRMLTADFLTRDRAHRGMVNVVNLSPQTTRDLEEMFGTGDPEALYLTNKVRVQEVLETIFRTVTSSRTTEQLPILVTKRSIRSFLSSALRRRAAPVFVASYDEITSLPRINVVGTV